MSLTARVRNLENKGSKYGHTLALVIQKAADRVVRLNFGETIEQARERLNIEPEQDVLFISRVVVEPKGQQS
jgi:hypothetical protein